MFLFFVFISYLGEVAGGVGVDSLEEGQLVGDELEGEDADERRQPVVGGDHDRVAVQALGKLQKTVTRKEKKNGYKTKENGYKNKKNGYKKNGIPKTNG